MLLCGESEHFVLARRIYDLHVGQRHARVVMQIALATARVANLWGAERCEKDRTILSVVCGRARVNCASELT